MSMTRAIKPIRDEQSYAAALAHVDELIDATPGTPAGDELDVLIDLIERYEDKTEPMGIPSPLAAIQFRMEQGGLKPRDLMPYIGSRAKVSEVLSGKRPLTLAMARALHNGLGIPASVLLQDEPLQQVAPDWDRYPVKQMRKLGWIDPTLPTAEAAMADLMLRARPGPSGASCVGYFRKSDMKRKNAKADAYALDAWCLAILAKSHEVIEFGKGRYQRGVLTDDFLNEIASLSQFQNGPLLARKLLAEHGVALVVLQHLAKTYVDGAALLRNDETPVVGMTLRYDRQDHFWFCLLHELAHVRLHLDPGTSDRFVDDMSIEGQGVEHDADDLAKKILIPESTWAASAAKLDPSPLNIASLAAAVKRSPAVIAGRVRHDTKNYRLLSHFVGTGTVQRLFDTVDR